MRIKVGLFLIALTTLLIELLLIRVFDVILNPNMGYMILTTALLSLGIGGIYRAVKPLSVERDVNSNLASHALFYELPTLV